MKADAKDRKGDRRAKRGAPVKAAKGAGTKGRKPSRTAKPARSTAVKPAPKAVGTRSAAKSQGLATVDALLGKPGAAKASDRPKGAVADAPAEGRAGATAMPPPAPRSAAAAAVSPSAAGASRGQASGAASVQPPAPTSVPGRVRDAALFGAAPVSPTATTAGRAREATVLGHQTVAATAPVAGVAGRFERAIARTQKGEPGPIRLADLTLDEDAARVAVATGRVELYAKLLEANPAAQPGRPLVNVAGTCDQDLTFQLLSLHELVLAARQLGREIVQVSLVRLPPAEAAELLARSPLVDAPAAAPETPLSPRAIAEMNGFLELRLAAIDCSENLRQEIDTTSHEFHNLVESIRTIGLQNPPVVEVRDVEGQPDARRLVCVSGHRRLLALGVLEQETVTCALKVFRSERHRALAGLAENINREDLHFLDKADGYGLLAKQAMSPGEIAALLDSDQRTVSKYLRASAWDPAVKRRIRELGAKATTRFLLNTLAAGERTTQELQAMLDRFVAGGAGRSGASTTPAKGPELRRRLGEFYALSECSMDQRLVVEKALRFLGFLK